MHRGTRKIRFYNTCPPHDWPGDTGISGFFPAPAVWRSLKTGIAGSSRLSTRRLEVRILIEEPNLSATSPLRLPVDSGPVSTPRNGQYSRVRPLSGGGGDPTYAPRGALAQNRRKTSQS